MGDKPTRPKGAKTARKHEFVWDGRGERGDDARLSIAAGRAATDLQLNEFDLRLLMHLGRFNQRKGWCRLSQTGLATMFGVSRGHVNRRVKLLVRRKYIAKKEQEKTGESFCYYRIIIDEELIGATDGGVSSGEHTPQEAGVSSGEHTPAEGGVSSPEHTPAEGGVSSGEHTGGVSSPEHTGVTAREHTGVTKLEHTPIYIERARLHVGHVDKTKKEEDARARKGTDAGADLFSAAQRATERAGGKRKKSAADEIASGERLPFSFDVVRELTGLGVDVEALVERYSSRTKGKRIADPSAYLLKMGHDAAAKQLGVPVAQVVAMSSRDHAARLEAITAGTITGPSVDAVERAKRLRNPYIDAALTMLEGQTFPNLIAADRAFQAALVNARFAMPRGAAIRAQQAQRGRHP